MNPRGLPNPARCPIKLQAEQTLRLSQSLLTSMQRLRAALRACQACPLAYDCLFLQSYSNAVTQAISDLTEAWNLGEACTDV